MLQKWIMIALSSLLLGSCGKKETQIDETAQAVERPSHVDKTPVDHPSIGTTKCYGNQVPPTSYLQETAFVPAGSPNASAEAQQLAKTQLRDRICQGYRCAELEPMISIWHTEGDSMQVCAMALIKSEKVAEFMEGPLRRLDADLAARAGQIVKNVVGQREPRIAFDNVTDGGVDGGLRAEWLINRMSSAISKEGVLISRIPADWSGVGVPRGSDAVLRANITPMHGREAMLEVTWKIQLPRGMKAVDPIAFPELIGPSINPLSQLPELAGINPSIGLRFDARPGGGLCNGQTTELRLETSQDLHVRVVNLFGDGSRGMVVFASQDVVKPQQTQSLGEFQVVKATKVPVERFVVLGAKSKSGLGPLANVKAPCRIPSDLAIQLSSNRGIPDGAKDFVTSRSYRILDGAECSSFKPKDIAHNWFESYPTCY